MAPLFLKNMYQIYKTKQGVAALICFAVPREGFEFKDDPVFKFRNILAFKITQSFNVSVEKSIGEPTPFDSLFYFYDKDTINNLSHKTYPGLIAWFLNTKKWKDYEKAVKERKLARFKIETSHDYPCIEVYSLLHTEEMLAKLIESVAHELNTDMSRNAKLPPIHRILFTNKTFAF